MEKSSKSDSKFEFILLEFLSDSELNDKVGGEWK